MNDPITQETIDTWRTHYGLATREPVDAAAWWATHYKGAPAGAVAALGEALLEIERLQRALKEQS